MAVGKPGVKTRQEIVSEETASESATLPTVLVGPLYDVFEQESTGSTYDERLTSNQSFSWPSLEIGAIVDLAGVRQGRIDSQRKQYVNEYRDGYGAVVPEVHLVDGTQTIQIDDADIESIDQSGFELVPGAAENEHRAELNVYGVNVNGEAFLYSPDGGLGAVETGDLFTIGGSNFEASEVTPTRIYASSNMASAINGSFSVDKAESTDSTTYIDIGSASTPGRINASFTGDTFGTSVAQGSVAIVGREMSGLTDMSAQFNADSSGAEFDNVDFGQAFGSDDLDGYYVKAVDDTAGDIHFGKVQSVDTSSSPTTLDTDIAVGDLSNSTDGDGYTLTVYEADLGQVEDVNAARDTVTISVPEVFSDSETFVYFVNSAQTKKFYPSFDVAVTYRALRADLANETIEITDEGALDNLGGSDDPDYRDVLKFAADIHLNSQEAQRPFYCIPVDLEPSGSTGLPQNEDLAAGYSDAFEAAKSLEGYNLLPLDGTEAVQTELSSHVTALSDPDQNKERRGFVKQEIPNGEWDQATGQIAPGRIPGGIASSADDSNMVIRDDSLDFASEAGIQAGDDIEVTFPEKFAGTYEALGTTTDNDLILDGDGWQVDHEFQPGDGSNDHQMTISEPNSDGIFLLEEHSSGPTISNGFFSRVEVGDYVDAQVDFGSGQQRYRLRVTDVQASGTELRVTDEVPGGLSLSSSADALDVSVIRSWSPDQIPAVRYSVRPLTTAETVDQLESSNPFADRRMTTYVGMPPTMQIGTNAVGAAIEATLYPELVMVPMAAKRATLAPHQDISNLFLDAGFERVEGAYDMFDDSQITDLINAGYVVVEQQSRNGNPYIVDFVTSDTTSAEDREEVVTSNTDWMAKTIRAIFGLSPGEQPPNYDSQGFLLGMRTSEINNILSTWQDEGRLIRYEVLDVSRDESNRRKTNMLLDLTVPAAEKEIDVTLQVTV